MYAWTIDVGWTDSRPVIPDEHVSRVQVLADTESEAVLTAALMVMRPASEALGLREVQMPTSTTIVALVL